MKIFTSDVIYCFYDGNQIPGNGHFYGNSQLQVISVASWFDPQENEWRIEVFMNLLYHHFVLTVLVVCDEWKEPVLWMNEGECFINNNDKEWEWYSFSVFQLAINPGCPGLKPVHLQVASLFRGWRFSHPLHPWWSCILKLQYVQSNLEQFWVLVYTNMFTHLEKNKMIIIWFY